MGLTPSIALAIGLPKLVKSKRRKEAESAIVEAEKQLAIQKETRRIKEEEKRGRRLLLSGFRTGALGITQGQTIGRTTLLGG